MITTPFKMASLPPPKLIVPLSKLIVTIFASEGEVLMRGGSLLRSEYYIYIYIYTHMCIYIYICIYTYIHTSTHTYMHTYIHTYMHAYIHTYIHTYTYNHIPIYPGGRTETNMAISI